MKETSPIPSSRTSIWRGIQGKCPACGQTKLFKAYLKPKEKCEHCGTNFSKIHTEDGPAWLTILLMGPILMPLLAVLVIKDWPSYIIFPILALSIVLAILLLLPRVKGAIGSFPPFITHGIFQCFARGSTGTLLIHYHGEGHYQAGANDDEQ